MLLQYIDFLYCASIRPDLCILWLRVAILFQRGFPQAWQVSLNKAPSEIKGESGTIKSIECVKQTSSLDKFQ